MCCMLFARQLCVKLVFLCKLSPCDCKPWFGCVEQVMHVLLARGPLELELPHTRSSMTLAEYSSWMDSLIVASDGGSSVAGSQADRTRLLHAGRPSYVHAEQAVWVRVRGCLDRYAQRTSASPARGVVVVPGDASNTTCEEYAWLVANCPKLLATYRDGK